METKTRKKAKKQRFTEEKKKKQLEYIQQLQDKMLAENTTFLEGAKRSQIVRSKYKKVPLEDNIDHWPSKKTKEKQLVRYYRDIGIKIEGTNPCKRYVYTGQNYLVYNSK